MENIKSIRPPSRLVGQSFNAYTMENIQVEVVVKKRGRPAGSQNRSKEVIAAEKAAKAAKKAEKLKALEGAAGPLA